MQPCWQPGLRLPLQGSEQSSEGASPMFGQEHFVENGRWGKGGSGRPPGKLAQCNPDEKRHWVPGLGRRKWKGQILTYLLIIWIWRERGSKGVCGICK